MEKEILDFIESSFQLLGWGGVVVTMGLESAGIPIPSELIMPLSGWMLIKEQGLGLNYIFLAALYGTLGNIWGSLLAYWIGLKGGRSLIQKYGRYVLLSTKDLERGEVWFKKYGEVAIFVSRLTPGVRTFISFPAGMVRMNLTKFLIYSFLGAYPWCLGLTYGGYILGSHWERIAEVMRPVAPVILLALLVGFGYYLYHRLKTA